MLQRDEQKAPIYKLSRSKAPETQQIEGYKHQRKPVDFLIVLDGRLLSLPQ